MTILPSIGSPGSVLEPRTREPACGLAVSNLTVAAIDGTRARSLLNDLDFTSIGRPSWSPDGASIAFSGDSDDLFTVTLAGGPYQVLTTLLDGADVDQNPDWGPKS